MCVRVYSVFTCVYDECHACTCNQIGPILIEKKSEHACIVFQGQMIHELHIIVYSNKIG